MNCVFSGPVMALALCRDDAVTVSNQITGAFNELCFQWASDGISALQRRCGDWMEGHVGT